MDTIIYFVEVLYSLLTLPMGTIVRLLEKHQRSEPVTVGCFNNLYRSVVYMKVDEFETEACKEMLLYPKSIKEAHCRDFKLNINPLKASSSLCAHISIVVVCVVILVLPYVIAEN